ncbi:hypothetical protein V6N12_049322 [Hibiscus sabdariffa]|uniref:squalene monooxygenase n=1 Tax=Hibiscus sabdariffa TaxID=183260 RepID=A0ABR2CCP3_9ROSI
MAEQYIVGVAGFIACLLGLVFLYFNSLVRFRGLSKLGRPATGNCGAVGTTDIIIVGAGVAGAALAYSLGKDGRRVRVIERDFTAPDRIAGEGLMPGGYLKLIELGLKDCVDDIDARHVLGLVLYKNGKDATLSFPVEKFESHVAAKCFHNGRFVQRLREKAASVHNVSLEQGTVTSLIEENGTVTGVRYKDKSGRLLTAYAPLTVVCDGCFSNLRRSLCNPKVDIPSHFAGLVLTNCKLPNEKYGALILAEPSPILFYPISSTEIRCLVDMPSRNVPSVSDGALAHYLKSLVAPNVFPELYPAFISAIEKGNIRVMPNRVMAAAPNRIPGAFLIGDALNIRHPLTGGGMTVALSDVVLVRNLLRPLHDLSDASAVFAYLESFYTLRKPMSSTINTMANVLQVVFSAPTGPVMEDIQQACFGYLRLGGVYANGVSAIFSGLHPSPLSLAFHFFAIVLYGVGRLLLPFPSPNRLWNGAKLLWVASSILLPFLWSEGVRQMFFPLTVPAYYRTPPGNCIKIYVWLFALLLFSAYMLQDGRRVRVIEIREIVLMRSMLNEFGVIFYTRMEMMPIVGLEQGTVTSLIEENGTVKGVHYKDKTGRLPTAYAPLTIMDAAPHSTPGALLTGGDACNVWHAITRGPMPSTINTLANVLHKVFGASSDPEMENVQQALFVYLKLGGVFLHGVSAMLSGLCPRPSSLAFHFAAIAIYGVGRLQYTNLALPFVHVLLFSGCIL